MDILAILSMGPNIVAVSAAEPKAKRQVLILSPLWSEAMGPAGMGHH